MVSARKFLTSFNREQGGENSLCFSPFFSPLFRSSVAEAETRPDSSSDPVNDGDSTSGGETPDPLPTLAEVRAALASTVAQSRTFPRRLAAKNGEQVEDGDEELAERKRVRKPPRDTSAYSVFSVPALKLEGVAIADQEEAVGSFAVSVGCGFFHDPPAIPGVAHQLEHLIFLGAEGEEAATSWDEFVSQRGGTHNAHTTAELTTFFVAAPTDTLPELLDRLLLHLFHPLLAAEQFASEVMAVQFEHEKNQPDVARVLLELAMAVTPSLASPASSATQDEVPTSFYRPEVARKFGTGDFDTLCKTPLEQGLDVLKALREFHGKCYKPENMTIAVRMGRRSVPIIVEGAVDASGQSLRIPAEVEAAAEREAEKRSVYTPKEIGEMVVRILSKYVQANSPETEAHADKTKTPHNKGNSFSASSSSDLTPQRTPSDASSSASPSVSSAPASSQAKRRNEVLKTVRLHAGERQKEASQVASLLEAAVGEDAYRSRPNATAEDSSPTDGESDASGKLYRVFRQHGWGKRLLVVWERRTNWTVRGYDEVFQPTALLEYLLEYPGEAALLNRLKAQGLIADAEYVDYTTSQKAFVALLFELTDEGEEKFEDVVSATLAYAEQLRTSVTETYILDFFDEFARVANRSWTYKDPEDAVSAVIAAAEKLAVLPQRPDMVIAGGEFVSLPGDRTLLVDVLKEELESFGRARASAIVVLPEDTARGSAEVVHAFRPYGVQFSVSALPSLAQAEKVGERISRTDAAEKMELLHAELASEDLISHSMIESSAFPLPPVLACNVAATVALTPRRVPEICQSLSPVQFPIKGGRSDSELRESSELPLGPRSESLEDAEVEEERKKLEASGPPCVLVTEESFSVFWKNAEPFNKPIVRGYFKLRVSAEDATAQNTLYGKIFATLAGERARTALASFQGCGVDLLMSFTNGALVLEIQAFSELFAPVLARLIEVLKESQDNVKQSDFNKIFNTLKVQLSDFSTVTPFELALDVALSVVRRNRFSQLDLRSAVTDASSQFEDFKVFLEKVLTKNALDVFIMGDIDYEEARKLAEDFRAALSKQPLPFSESAGSEILNLADDIEIRFSNPIPEDATNAYVSLYVTHPPPDMMEMVVYSLIGEVISSPFFDTIRTHWMDGYVAAAAVREVPPAMTLATIVQGSQRKPDELERHVCAFLAEMEENIGSSMTTEAFLERLRWLSSSKFHRSATSFSDYFGEVTSQIASRNFCFIREQLARLATEKFLSCPAILKSYMNSLVDRANRKRITVKIEGNSSSSETASHQREIRAPSSTLPNRCGLPGLSPSASPSAEVRQAPSLSTQTSALRPRPLSEKRETTQSSEPEAPETSSQDGQRSVKANSPKPLNAAGSVGTAGKVEGKSRKVASRVDTPGNERRTYASLFGTQNVLRSSRIQSDFSSPIFSLGDDADALSLIQVEARVSTSNSKPKAVLGARRGDGQSPTVASPSGAAPKRPAPPAGPRDKSGEASETTGTEGMEVTEIASDVEGQAEEGDVPIEFLPLARQITPHILERCAADQNAAGAKRIVVDNFFTDPVEARRSILENLEAKLSSTSSLFSLSPSSHPSPPLWLAYSRSESCSIRTSTISRAEEVCGAWRESAPEAVLIVSPEQPPAGMPSLPPTLGDAEPPAAAVPLSPSGAETGVPLVPESPGSPAAAGRQAATKAPTESEASAATEGDHPRVGTSAEARTRQLPTAEQQTLEQRKALLEARLRRLEMQTIAQRAQLLKQRLDAMKQYGTRPTTIFNTWLGPHKRGFLQSVGGGTGASSGAFPVSAVSGRSSTATRTQAASDLHGSRRLPSALHQAADPLAFKRTLETLKWREQGLLQRQAELRTQLRKVNAFGSTAGDSTAPNLGLAEDKNLRLVENVTVASGASLGSRDQTAIAHQTDVLPPPRASIPTVPTLTPAPSPVAFAALPQIHQQLPGVDVGAEIPRPVTPVSTDISASASAFVPGSVQASLSQSPAASVKGAGAPPLPLAHQPFASLPPAPQLPQEPRVQEANVGSPSPPTVVPGVPTVGATAPTVGEGATTLGAGAPAVASPAPTVGAAPQAVTYTAPTMGAGAPTVASLAPTVGAAPQAVTYTAPTTGAGAPAVASLAPTVGAAPQAVTYTAPTIGAGAPAVASPAPTVGAAPQAVTYTAPTIGAGAPAVASLAPTVGAAPQAVTYTAPTIGAGAPAVASPAPTVGAAPQAVTYTAPTIGAGAPAVASLAPAVGAAPQAVTYTAPTIGAGAPAVASPAPTVGAAPQAVTYTAPTMGAGAPAAVASLARGPSFDYQAGVVSRAVGGASQPQAEQAASYVSDPASVARVSSASILPHAAVPVVHA
ncbi:toxolysin TLN4 [Toxoplasma gondii ME49]|uniref:Toxolysin TLN4 n=1 Tax=Toxoplasma gondii (strain ATCC 50611 / Me49) TaxID=508771 RepID=S8GMZ4_TOXGM|nr:toxolysin TLN4 [Toxoplasma gondii ME49]EPT29914.1 toxolysin TLN4 [Toxoplasma gondii ME49]|eukprot:XP_018637247.1 toxolysin TLN4 [Toxoplasma gondii ME49]